MDEKSIALWMQAKLEQESCLYQDDVVDFVISSKYDHLLRENVDGNVVLGRKILNEFKKLNIKTVVWVRPDRYWRFRVPEDEDSRDARG
jgi:hypothetical protein